jgi:RimJ/RimL family protein N-acetyltransferase
VSKFEIRPPTLEDAAAFIVYLRALHEKVDHPGVIQRTEFPTEEIQREWITKYTTGGGYCLVVLSGARIVGCAELTRGRGPHRSHCASLGISLLKEARSQGYGTHLISKLHDWAGAQPGLERIQLEVFHTNPNAIRLYERFGYVHEGRRVGSIKRFGESIDMIQMSMLIER